MGKPDMKLPDIPQYVLNQSMLEPVEANIGNRCPWCVNESDGDVSLLKLVEQKVLTWNKTSVQEISVQLLSDMSLAVDKYLSKSWVQEVGTPVLTKDVYQLRDSFRAASTTVEGVLKETEATIRDVNDAVQYTHDLMDNNWKLECSSQLPKLIEEYNRFYATFRGTLGNVRNYLDNYKATNEEQLDMYISGERSLEDLTNALNFKDFLMKTQAAKYKIENAINKGQMQTKTIHFQINQIFYSFLSYTDQTVMSANSSYMKHLNIRSPQVKIPELRLIQDIKLPEMDFGMVPDKDAADTWKTLVDNLSNMRMELHYLSNEVDVVMNDAKEYFSTYVKGNQVDVDFYS